MHEVGLKLAYFLLSIATETHTSSVTLWTLTGFTIPLVLKQIACYDVINREIGWRTEFTRRASWSALQRSMGHSMWW